METIKKLLFVLVIPLLSFVPLKPQSPTISYIQLATCLDCDQSKMYLLDELKIESEVDKTLDETVLYYENKGYIVAAAEVIEYEGKQVLFVLFTKVNIK